MDNLSESKRLKFRDNLVTTATHMVQKGNHVHSSFGVRWTPATWGALGFQRLTDGRESLQCHLEVKLKAIQTLAEPVEPP